MLLRKPCTSTTARTTTKNAQNLYNLLNYFLFILLILHFVEQHKAIAFCQTGCECWDELKKVECKNISTIPILFHPLLRLLTVSDSPHLKLDPVSIGLYQELEFLDLSRNNIHQIPDGFLTPLKKLRELRLRGNKLKVVDTATFEKLFHSNRHLQVLDLSENELERIEPKVFLSNRIDSGLIALNLSGNHLHVLEPQSTFRGLERSLKFLDLSHNRIAVLDATIFNTTPMLESLNLAGNILSEIPNGLFRSQKKLIRLNISRNLISTIGASVFSGLDSLLMLDLSNNLITKINNFAVSEKYLHTLTSLYLSFNPIVEIPTSAFNGLVSLKELILHSMPELKAVRANAFVGLLNLESLVISNCPKLTELASPLFDDMQSVSLSPDDIDTKQTNEIWRSNPMSSIKLTKLDLSDNHLSTLEKNLLNDWNQLKWLSLSGNAWNCNCQLLQFLPEILRNLSITDTVYCVEPESLFNAKINEIESATLCNSSGLSADPLMTALMLLAAAFAVLTIIVTITALLCCCCWRYHIQNQQRRKQRLDQSPCLFGQQKRGKYFLPFFRRFGALKSVKNATDTTVSSSSATSSSSSSSYCNGSSRDNHSCAPLYSSGAGTASFTESLIYEKAIPGVVAKLPENTSSRSALNHCYSIPPLINNSFQNRENGRARQCCLESDNNIMCNNAMCNFGSAESEYYSCIMPPSCAEEMTPRSKSGINLNYCLPPSSNNCCAQQYRTYRHPTYCKKPSISNGKAQVLISYGNNTIAYPPYMFQSRSNFALNNDELTSNFKHNTECNDSCATNPASNCNFGVNASAGDSGCCVFDGIAEFGSENNSSIACRPPSFIAPPPPSTIPPPPFERNNASPNFQMPSYMHYQRNNGRFNEIL